MSKKQWYIVIAAILVAVVLATIGGVVMFVVGLSQYADIFSGPKFDKVKLGMTSQQVLAVTSAPNGKIPQPDGSLVIWWLTAESTDEFEMYFTNDRLVRTIPGGVDFHAIPSAEILLFPAVGQTGLLPPCTVEFEDHGIVVVRPPGEAAHIDLILFKNPPFSGPSGSRVRPGHVHITGTQIIPDPNRGPPLTVLVAEQVL